jgi:hypothetical protein
LQATTKARRTPIARARSQAGCVFACRRRLSNPLIGGNYTPTVKVSTSAALESRGQTQIFAMLGWIAAGALKPANWFAYLIRGMPEFNCTISA